MSATRLSGEAGGRGSFVVPSASMPGEAWVVEWVTFGTSWCPCPAFALKHACRHVEAADAAVQAEARHADEASAPGRRARAAARLEQIAEEFAL